MKGGKAFEKDDMGAHARLYEQIGKSPAWLALGFSSRALYVQLRLQLKGFNNGNIEATLSTLRHAGFKSSSTLAKCVREIEAVGLIAKTRQGGIAAGGKTCNLFRFTDKLVYEQPKVDVKAQSASQDWRQWASLGAAQAAIRQAHAAAKRPTRKKEIAGKLQISNRISSIAEASHLLVDSEIEQVKASPLRKSKLGLAA